MKTKQKLQSKRITILQLAQHDSRCETSFEKKKKRVFILHVGALKWYDQMELQALQQSRQWLYLAAANCTNKSP